MATQSIDLKPEGRSRPRARGSYFFWVSVILLALVLIGFAPTLYLRAWFPQTAEPNMPLYLYLHGAVLTAWFAWLASQTWLVRSGRTALHRRMGWIGAAIAAGVCVAGPLATFGVVERILAFGLTLDDDVGALPAVGVEGITVLEFAAPIVWGNLMMIAAFAGLIVAAILLRKRTEYHKRLMLVASIALVVPALARISRWPVFGGEDSLLIPVVGVGLLISVTGHDLLTRRKPHPATIIGTVLVLGVAIGSEAIAASGFGQAFVRSLG